MVIHLRLQLLLLAFEALDHADFSSFLLCKLMIAVSQAICHVLALLIIQSLSHPQSRVVHLIVMPLFCKLFIILHFEFLINLSINDLPGLNESLIYSIELTEEDIVVLSAIKEIIIWLEMWLINGRWRQISVLCL
jgi:hypothetical protein